MVDRKLLSRVEKLLRLAGPQSNTTEAERTSAALEAARLFNENGFLIAAKEEKEKVSRRRPAPANPPSYVGHNYQSFAPWFRSVATSDSVCVDPDCDEAIERGDDVWARENGRIEYLHFGRDCGW